MKRIIAFFISCAFFISSAAYASDISGWAEAEFAAANRAGLVSYNVMQTSLQQYITREEFCTLAMPLYERLGGDKVSDTGISPFSDTDSQSVLEAYSLGIVSGVSDTEFDPYSPITKEQMAKMLVKAAMAADCQISISGNEDILIQEFRDSDDVSEWARTSVAAMLKYEIIKGTDKGEIKPLANVTAEQAVLMSYRVFCAFSGSGEYEYPDVPEVIDNGDSIRVSWSGLEDAIKYAVILKSDGVCLTNTTNGLSAVISKRMLDNNNYTVIVCAVYDDGTTTFSGPASVEIENSDSEPEIEDVFSSVFGDFAAQVKEKNEKETRIFGDGGQRYATKEEAELHMTEVAVDVWRIDSDGEKTASKLYLTVNAALADDVVQIFREIFEDESRFPIKSAGGFQWRTSASGRQSEHSYGTCIDINPNENYYVSRDGQAISGSYWKPGEDPYSVTEDGIVVKTFAKYGFLWGGNAWGENSAKDYMHFTYLGN